MIRLYSKGEYGNAVEYYQKAAESMETEDKERLELSELFLLFLI